MIPRRLGILATVVPVVIACWSSDARLPDNPGTRATGYVDSALTIEEAVRRFREELPPVTRFTGGAAHRDTLIVRFVEAVERGDTAAIRTMVMTRAEFAYIYYPASPYSRPPAHQAPALAWFLMVQESQKGITRVFERHAHRPFDYVSHACEPTPRAEDGFRFWDRCAITYREQGTLVTRQLSGSVIERGGHYKFVSYANDY